MATADRRTPPADPWDITLAYQHEHPWWHSADDAPETWHVSAGLSDAATTSGHVGDMRITLVDLYETRDPFALLDGEDAELGKIAQALFDPADGKLAPDFDEELEPTGDRLLILHSVQLTPPWRGYGLGPLLAGTAIRNLASGARAAVCYPAPLKEPTDPAADGQRDPADWDKAVTALGQVWAKLGFQHFRDGVHVLDLSLVTLDENLRQLTRNTERYRTPGH